MLLEKVFSRKITTNFVSSNDQFTNIFIKPLNGFHVDCICNEPGERWGEKKYCIIIIPYREMYELVTQYL